MSISFPQLQRKNMCTILPLNWQCKWNGSFTVEECVIEFSDLFSETSVAWVQTQDFALEVQQNMRTFAQLPSSWAHSAAVVVIPENLALQAASLQAGQMGEQEIDFWGKVVGMEAIDEMVAFLQGSPCPIGQYSETECLFFLYKDGLNCVHPPLNSSCLQNPLDRGAWWAIVHRVTQSWTWLKRLSMPHKFLCWSPDIQYLRMKPDSKEIKPVNPKGNQLWLFIGNLLPKLMLQYFNHLIRPPDSTHRKRLWCWERLRAGGEGDDGK